MAGAGLRTAGLAGNCACPAAQPLQHAVMKFPILLAAAALLPPPPRPLPTPARPRSRREKPAAKADTTPLKQYFHASEVRSTGSVTVGGQPIAYDAVAGTLVVHAKDWSDTDALDADADKSADKDKARAQARSVDVLHRLFQAGRACREPADHLPVQRRAGLVDGVAAHGRVRPGARRHRRSTPHAGRALYGGQQRPEPARRQRPRVHRRAGHRLQPHRRQGQGKERSTASTRTSTPSPSSSPSSCRKYGRWNSPKYLFGESYGTMRGGAASRSRCRTRTST